MNKKNNKKNNEKKLRITSKIGVLAGIGFLWIFGTVYFLPNVKTASTKQLIDLAFSSIGGFGIVSATILNVWNALDTSRNNLKQIEFQKVENSIKYLERWDTELLFNAREFARSIESRRAKMADADLKTEINSNDKYQGYVILIFNFWEEIYLSIESGLTDEAILKRAFARLYLTQYHNFKVWIEESKDEGYQEMANNLEKLETRWKNL